MLISDLGSEKLPLQLLDLDKKKENRSLLALILLEEWEDDGVKEMIIKHRKQVVTGSRTKYSNITSSQVSLGFTL